MSVQSQITRLENNVAASLQVVAAKGVTVSEDATSDDLPALIAEIETASADDTGWVNFSSYGASFPIYYRKIGKQVIIRADPGCSCYAQANTWANIATNALPADCRPSYTVIMASGSTYSKYTPVFLRVNTSGVLSVYVIDSTATSSDVRAYEGFTTSFWVD